MRRYESVVILDPDMADDDVSNFTERYSRVIKQNGGEIIKIEDWGSKKLAYLVRKKDRGRYILLDYVGLPALLNEVERQFKISDEVMKFISVKVDDNVTLEAFKAASEKKEEPVAHRAPLEPAVTAVPAAAQEVREATEEAAVSAAVEFPAEEQDREISDSGAPTDSQSASEQSAEEGKA
jgi:small subunit ribosomal protein S6